MGVSIDAEVGVVDGRVEEGDDVGMRVGSASLGEVAIEMNDDCLNPWPVIALSISAMAVLRSASSSSITPALSSRTALIFRSFRMSPSLLT